MSEQNVHPSLEQLLDLARPHETAVTIYASTSPEDRDKSKLVVKAAFDEAIRELRVGGVSRSTEEELRRRWAQYEDSLLWGKLSSSIVLLLADDVDELFVLPNRFEDRVQVGTYFDLSQLVRAATTPQEAFGLTLSQNGWNLWHGTATRRAEEMVLAGEHPTDVADATNRATVRDRGYVGRLVGDEGRTVLLETYASRVAESVVSELPAGNGSAPLFVFATSPLLELYLSADRTGRTLVVSEGSPDALGAHDVDTAMRAGLPTVNADVINDRLDRLGDGIAHGTVARDLADIAKAASLGAVETLIYDVTSDVTGEVDLVTGALSYSDDGYHVLSRLALQVLDTGGQVFAVRPEEIRSATWIAPAVAGLRFALA